jgi:hypothetical protein
MRDMASSISTIGETDKTSQGFVAIISLVPVGRFATSMIDHF